MCQLSGGIGNLIMPNKVFLFDILIETLLFVHDNIGYQISPDIYFSFV